MKAYIKYRLLQQLNLYGEEELKRLIDNIPYANTRLILKAHTIIAIRDLLNETTQEV